MILIPSLFFPLRYKYQAKKFIPDITYLDIGVLGFNISIFLNAKVNVFKVHWTHFAVVVMLSDELYLWS